MPSAKVYRHFRHDKRHPNVVTAFNTLPMYTKQIITFIKQRHSPESTA